MNWEAIGAIGQAISALALVAVIAQIRLTAGETLRLVRQDRWDDVRRGLMDQAQSEWLNRVVAKGLRAYGDESPFEQELVERGLTPAEATAFDAWMHSWWIADVQHVAHIDQLTKGERAVFDGMMRAAYRQGGSKSRYFELNRPGMNPDAVRYMEGLKEQPDRGSPTT